MDCGRALGAISGIALIASAGCGTSASHPELDVFVQADWNWGATSADQIGFVYTITIEQAENSQGTCGDLPQSLQVVALGQPAQLDPNAQNCFSVELTTGPTLQPSAAVFTAEVHGEMFAQATIDGLTPGSGATLVSPSDGMVHPGDGIVVAATPGLPSNEIFGQFVFPLEVTPWPGSQGSSVAPVRLFDGVHAVIPAFSGRAAAVFKVTPYTPVPTISCQGFANCRATASNVLGPVFVTETP